MSALNLLVFREDRRSVSGEQLRTAVAAQLEQQGGSYSPDFLVNALLLSGELECGIADAQSADATSADVKSAVAKPAEILTEQLASALVRNASSSTLQSSSLQHLVSSAKSLFIPEQLTISTPEGFAYYALHPLAYADVLDRIPLSAKDLVVVGIRSIGTTLSAMVAAAARLRELQTQRFTIRPLGHPYNRRTEFSPEQI